MAEALLYFVSMPIGKKAGRAKEDFGHAIPTSFKILDVVDEAAAVSHVQVQLVFPGESEPRHEEVSVRATYQDAENKPLIRGEPNGSWRIVQNSFSKVIYAIGV